MIDYLLDDQFALGSFPGSRGTRYHDLQWRIDGAIHFEFLLEENRREYEMRVEESNR